MSSSTNAKAGKAAAAAKAASSTSSKGVSSSVSRPKPCKPYPLEDYIAVYRKTDQFDRLLFTITEDQYDELIAQVESMDPNAQGPCFYDNFDNEYTLRGKMNKKATAVQLEEGVEYELAGRIIKTTMSSGKDAMTGKKRTSPTTVVYFTIDSINGEGGVALPPIEEEPVEEPVTTPEPMKKKAKVTRGKAVPKVTVEDNQEQE